MVQRSDIMKSPSNENQYRARSGLHALDRVGLAPREKAFLHEIAARCGGDPAWKRRKLREAHDLLALAQLAPERLAVQMLDPRDDLRVVVKLRTPVPCRADRQGDLEIANEATLGITYPRAILGGPLAGFSLVQILIPLHVWHANVAQAPLPQSLCLAAKLPQGTRLPQLVVLSYAALSMQSVMVDETDAAGVLNADAARWWQGRLDRTPLSREPFIPSATSSDRAASEVSP